ncbi:PEP-CTERM sorting domain-containing protein [Akkermansiaceae bacterium]|nr:PEP-CTERM sorting domain-containing protein [Akkermansiaceae bacterium]
MISRLSFGVSFKASCLPVVCAIAVSTHSAQAALLAYDQFVGYTAGNLGGQGQGFGWANNWTGGLVDAGGGLTYGSLPASGGKAQTAVTTSQFTGMSRNLASGISSGTVYVGWLAEKGGSDPTQMWLSLNTSANNDRIGAGIWPSSSTQWRLIRNDSGSFGDLSSGKAITDEAAHFVIKLDLSPGNPDTARLFVNPASAGDLTNANADATYTFSGTGIAADLTTITLSRQNANTPNGDGQIDQVAFDEIRIGTEAADMFSVIPEPSSAALIGLSTFLMLRRRRCAP